MGYLSCLSLLLVAAKLFGFAHYGWLVALAPTFFAPALALLVATLTTVQEVLAARKSRKLLAARIREMTDRGFSH